jgi:PKD repeat protein
VGGLTATVPTASNLATMLTVVLAPKGPNSPPEATFSSSCAERTCTFDGSGSTDADGEVREWAWDFGDGGTGAGRTAEHTYAAAGDRTVTLTVTDDAGATSRSTSTVRVTAPAPAQGIALRGSAGTATTTVSSASLTVPETVRAGDALVLVLSTNSTASGTAPAGYTQVASSPAGSSPTTQVFRRVAGAGDAGSRLTVPLSAAAKVTLQLLAYSGTHATAPVASVTGAVDGSGTAHTTPASSAAAGSWVVWVWSDKQAGARTWTTPAGTSERSNLGGAGNGDVATLVADSGGPVPAGPVAGRTATVPTASNRAVLFTIVLAPAG